jgi:DmsE family decaheme c-type cytochrome
VRKREWALSLLALGGAAIAVGVALIGADGEPSIAKAQDQAAADAPPLAASNVEMCLSCHGNPPVTDIFRTAHAVKADPRTPFAKQACETCHGASPEHMRGPSLDAGKRPPPAIVFGKVSKNSAAEQNGVCLGCHGGSARIHWKGSPHDVADTGCIACHQIHTTADPVLAKRTQPPVCFDCHKEQRAQFLKRSHHPVKEGLVACSECHNPHGSAGDKQLLGMTRNDTCYACHAEKRGPFLWEHAPVREDCTLCHQPHGSTQPRLLKARAPFLCQECHSAQFHPSAVYSGANQPPAAGHQLFAKGCLNCHSQVHGSNHPSGVRLMR